MFEISPKLIRSPLLGFTLTVLGLVGAIVSAVFFFTTEVFNPDINQAEQVRDLDSLLEKRSISSYSSSPHMKQTAHRLRELRERLDSIRSRSEQAGAGPRVRALQNRIRELEQRYRPPDSVSSMREVRNSIPFRVANMREDIESLESRIEYGFTWIRWGIGAIVLSFAAIYVGEKFGMR